MEWANEACDECKKDCLRIHGKRVPSFSKAITDKSCLQVLILPLEFARSVSLLTDHETSIEDASGLHWRVTVSYHYGSLAIRQGWPEFSLEHGLDVGDLLVFHYTPDKHFLVQIFGTSGREKIVFCCDDIGKGKKRARSQPEEPHLDVEAGIMATGMVSRPAEDIPLQGPKDKKSKEASQFDSGEEYANGNEKVIKSKVNYACLVTVAGRDFLELPESWQDLLQRPTRGRWIIFLRGLDNKIWPVFYHSRSGVDVLTHGWAKVAAAYGMNAEDDCLFQLADQQKHIFDIRKMCESSRFLWRNC